MPQARCTVEQSGTTQWSEKRNREKPDLLAVRQVGKPQMRIEILQKNFYIESMYQKKLEDDIRCPLEYGMEIFGGKWNSRIICVLSEKKTLRYSELKKELTDITDAVLASTLKSLIKNGIIEREQFNEIPPHVEYSLSKRGLSVVPILHEICQWAGIFHKGGNDKTLPQCRKCDYTDFSF